MNEVIMATLVGGLVGLVFGLVDLPIPAPPALSGVMGIVGIFRGYKVANYQLENWEQILDVPPL